MTEIEGELFELDHRIDQLAFYIESDEFKAAESVVRSTIGSQYLAMNQYATCLRMRLLVANMEGIETVLKEESNDEHNAPT